MKNTDIKTEYVIDLIDEFCDYIKYHLWNNYKQKDSLKWFYDDMKILLNKFILDDNLSKSFPYFKKAITKMQKKLMELEKCFDLPEDEIYKIAYIKK